MQSGKQTWTWRLADTSTASSTEQQHRRSRSLSPFVVAAIAPSVSSSRHVTLRPAGRRRCRCDVTPASVRVRRACPRGGVRLAELEVEHESNPTNTRESVASRTPVEQGETRLLCCQLYGLRGG
ncbi:hypothetical protein NHX12_030760 [Muraenolepis orangiensis]|uniref:Uncharacterized protein n=1 Tax=Muraenolepis orangiensis TaxID=630683 RepID=A0A9Q0D6C0_9TELE|nr:hypothetical protein NHX12_017168 [Muraenolepis orangiensis]KAJ3603016.1 hypothetical protein NHX12_030760 [Muraenolepis orangiensis]